MGLDRMAKERSIMTRNGFVALGLACGLMLATPLGPARAQSLTVPPDLRTPGQATGPAAAEPDAPAAKKPKREKRAAQAKARSATAPKLSAPAPRCAVCSEEIDIHAGIYRIGDVRVHPHCIQRLWRGPLKSDRNAGEDGA